MREKIFRWVLRNHTEGMMLTKSQQIVRALLFPIEWLISSHNPYDPMRDIWVIHGKKYSGRMLYELAKADGLKVEIRQQNDCTVLVALDT